MSGVSGAVPGFPACSADSRSNPWLSLNAVVTMFDSGGSSGQLRDELGVLPPGDVLHCALALARNEREARRVLLARLPALEHARLGGHTGGNLLLSMMERYSGDFLAAVEGLRSLLGCCRPRLAGQHRARQHLRASTATAATTRGEVEVDAGQSAGHVISGSGSSRRVNIHPAAAQAISSSTPRSSARAASTRA